MSESGLRRVLSARDLIFYGVVLITPIAPVPIYGVAQELARGHVIISLMLAGIPAPLFVCASRTELSGALPTLHPNPRAWPWLFLWRRDSR